MSLEDFLTSEIENIKQKNLYRKEKVLSCPASLYVDIEGQTYLNLCSNNYLNYADNPIIKKAAKEAIDKLGTGSTGSRLISGTSPLHIELESIIAGFKQTEAALFMSSGFIANVSTLSALLSEADVVFSDELNHASIIDGIKLSRAHKFIYKHNDPTHLKELLYSKRSHYQKALIVSDTVFSMDGDTANIKDLVELKNRYDCFLMLDEAHATGFFGNNGAGLAQESGLSSQIDIQMGTFSKAIGVEGSYIAGTSNLITFLKHKSRGYVYSTAPSPAVAGAIIAAINLMENDPSAIMKLRENVNYFKSQLLEIKSNIDIEVMPSSSPIFCFIVGDTTQTLYFQKLMMDKYRILLSAIRPPTVKTSRIRLCLSARLNFNELDNIINVINKVAKEVCNH